MNRAISLSILTLLLTVFAFNSGKATAAERFISVIDDLPLMAGLVEVKGSALVFSTPQGRIAEVSAKGASGKVDPGSSMNTHYNDGKNNKVGNLKAGQSAFE